MGGRRIFGFVIECLKDEKREMIRGLLALSRIQKIDAETDEHISLLVEIDTLDGSPVVLLE